MVPDPFAPCAALTLEHEDESLGPRGLLGVSRVTRSRPVAEAAGMLLGQNSSWAVALQLLLTGKKYFVGKNVNIPLKESSIKTKNKIYSVGSNITFKRKMFHCNKNIPLEQNRKMFLLKIQGEKEKKANWVV